MSDYKSPLKVIGIITIFCMAPFLPLMFSAFYCPPRPDIEDKYVLRKLAQAVVLFSIDTGKLPLELSELCDPNKGAKIPGWDGPYLNCNDLIDSWGSHYVLESRVNEFLILALGPDKLPNTVDDQRMNGVGFGPKCGELTISGLKMTSSKFKNQIH